MTGNLGEETLWSRTSIAIRQDILKQALASGLDINEICNQALARATGIPYVPPGQEPEHPPLPVIIAKNGAAAKIPPAVPKALSPVVHPVINADDPRSPTTVKQAPRPARKNVPATLPGRVSVPEKALATPPAPAGNRSEKPKTPSPKKPVKAKKGQAIKQFITEATARGDTDDGHVTKEALYLAFTSWCREHRVTPVPEKKAVTVALKNQFALKEKTIDGEPAWVNIRLR